MRRILSTVLYSLFVINFNQYCFSCLFKDSLGNYYNLSRLKYKPLQTNETEFKGESFILYFSLCQPLYQNFHFPTNSSSQIKPINAMGIIVRRSKLHGQIVTYFENLSTAGDKENVLTLKFQSQGGSCKSFPDLIYIHLICAEREKVPILNVINNCLFDVKWHTILGCPIKYKLENDCTLKFNSYSFDLMPLYNLKYYKAEFLNNIQKSKIYFNFCGRVDFKHCYSDSYGKISLCVNNKTYNFPQNFFNPTYDEKKSVLTIKGSHEVLNGGPSVEINLKCNHSVYHSFPIVSTRRRTFKVSFETYVACISYSNYKELLDEENSLRYKVPQIASKVETKNYIFLLNTSSQFGGIGISRNDYAIFSLGSLKTLKIINGSLNLIYTLGSLRNGVTCSSKIKFVCSKGTVGPTLVSELVNQKACQFEFVWSDSSACSVTASRGCMLRDPIFGYDFNFIGTHVFKIEHNEMIFKINLCRQAGEFCNRNNDTSVCLIKKNQEIIIGKRSSQFLTFNEGLLKFELTGETFAAKMLTNVFIKTICDYRSLISKPVFDEASSSDCVYNFFWKTKKACPDELTFDCFFNSTDGRIIDLNPLRRTSSNYRIRTNDSSLFLLNFCGSLWYGEKETCGRDSAACLIENGKSTVIGIVDNRKLFVDVSGEVSVIFKTFLFDTCPNGLVISTKITFQCDTSDKDPEYIGFIDCSYSFIWKTRHACFVQNRSTWNRTSVAEQNDNLSMLIPIERTNVIHSIPKTSTSQTEIHEDIGPAKENQSEGVEYEISKRVQSETNQFSGAVVSSNFLTNGYVTQSLSSSDKRIQTNHSSLIFLNIHNLAKFFRETCLTNFSCLIFGRNKGIRLNYTFLEKVSFTKRSKTESECDEINRKAFVSSKLFCQSPCEADLCIKKRDSWISGGFLQQVGSYRRESNRIVIHLNGGNRCDDQEDYTSQIELKCPDNQLDKNKEFWNWSLKEDNCKFTVVLISPLFCLVRITGSSSVSTTTIVMAVVFTVLIIIVPLCLCYFNKNWLTCRLVLRKRSETDLLLLRQERKCFSKEL